MAKRNQMVMTGLTALIVSFCNYSHSQSANQAAAAANQAVVPPPTTPQIVENAANQRTWQWQSYEVTPDGQTRTHIHQVQEIATGLNHLVGGQFVESSDEIEALPQGGAAATNTQQQVYFPGDIYQGTIRLIEPDGKILESRPTGLCYDNDANTVLFAELTNSVGYLASSNQVIYPDAFVGPSGFTCNLRYTVTPAGLEQDVIMSSSQPPAPEVFQMDSHLTQIQCLTEFFNVPEPAASTTMLPEQGGMVLADNNLNFGAMEMIPGKAFLMGSDGHEPGVAVSKTWVNTAGRQILVEAVPVMALASELLQLPGPPSVSKTSAPLLQTASGTLPLPPERFSKHQPKVHFAQRPALDLTSGLVMDYITVNSSATNMVFQGDSTYYVSGPFYSYGTNTFEGGTVLKYAAAGAMFITSGPPGTSPGINWKGGAYRPCIFTAADDNSIGESFGSGTPTGYYGNPMLNFTSFTLQMPVNGARFNFAQTAITVAGTSAQFYNLQVINCQNGINVAGGTAYFGNVLFANNVTNLIISGGGNVSAQNVTFSGSQYLISTPFPCAGTSLALTNCLMANVTNQLAGALCSENGYDNGFYNTPYTSALGATYYTNTFYPFQTVGGGQFYLASGCNFTNRGTTNIDATLWGQLRQKTTYPPIAFTNITFTTATNFSPQATRDNGGSLALGYHYDPLDYTFGGCESQSNMTFTAGTGVGWFRTASGYYHIGQGIHMDNQQICTFSGTATAPCFWVRLYNVQEQDYTAGYSDGGLTSWASQSGSITNAAVVNATFLHSGSIVQHDNAFRDDNGLLIGNFTDCEFSDTGAGSYVSSYYITNCLFDRSTLGMWQGEPGEGVFVINSTFHGGLFYLTPNLANIPVAVWDSAFDGTSMSISGYGANTNYATYNYNAYTNSSGSFPVGGTNNVIVTNGFNWQTSWFGNFYLPTNSPVITKGSTNANYLGLYHFTTQTNQTVEGDSMVAIGYHYVATDNFGNPIDSNNDSLPDYLADVNGTGVYGPGDLADWLVPVNSTVPSAWYTLNGLIPGLPWVGVQDADWDGLLNQQEYLYGSNPQVSEGFGIWLSTPNGTTSIP